MYVPKVSLTNWVPFPSYHCQCRIIQMTWQEWKYKPRKFFFLKKSKHQMCLQTSITLMILLTVIGWKKSNIDFVFTNRILFSHCSWQVADPPGDVQEISSAAAWGLVACFSRLYLLSLNLRCKQINYTLNNEARDCEAVRKFVKTLEQFYFRVSFS